MPHEGSDGPVLADRGRGQGRRELGTAPVSARKRLHLLSAAASFTGVEAGGPPALRPHGRTAQHHTDGSGAKGRSRAVAMPCVHAEPVERIDRDGCGVHDGGTMSPLPMQLIGSRHHRLEAFHHELARAAPGRCRRFSRRRALFRICISSPALKTGPSRPTGTCSPAAAVHAVALLDGDAPSFHAVAEGDLRDLVRRTFTTFSRCRAHQFG